MEDEFSDAVNEILGLGITEDAELVRRGLRRNGGKINETVDFILARPRRKRVPSRRMRDSGMVPQTEPSLPPSCRKRKKTPHEIQLEKVLALNVGDRVSFLWEPESKWYTGTILKIFRGRVEKLEEPNYLYFTIQLEGDDEIPYDYKLFDHKFTVLGTARRKLTNITNQAQPCIIGKAGLSDMKKPVRARNKKRRRRKPKLSAGKQTEPEFRMISVRQPWAEALLLGQKKIENRCFPFPEWLENCWLALHASRNFTRAERSEAGWEGRSTNEELKRTRGKIIGLIRFSGDVDSRRAKKLDRVFTDRPIVQEHHWVVSGALTLDKHIPVISNVRFPRVNDAKVRRILAKRLQKAREIQPFIPLPVKTKKKRKEDKQ